MNIECTQRIPLAPKFPLVVLVVEDNSVDAELCLEVLRGANFELDVDVVETPNAFLNRLRSKTYDIILADYRLVNWTGVDALEIMHKEGLDVPTILVTAELGDQRAIECMEHGFADYVLKSNLRRLPSAITATLEEKGLAKERRQAERLLKDSEAKFRALADAIPVAVFIEQKTQCRYANPAAVRLTGYRKEELLAMNFWQLIRPDARQVLVDHIVQQTDSDPTHPSPEIDIFRKDGEVRQVEVTVGRLRIDGELAALITAVDTTERVHTTARSSCAPYPDRGDRTEGWASEVSVCEATLEAAKAKVRAQGKTARPSAVCVS